jgi:hypothetical protein
MTKKIRKLKSTQPNQNTVVCRQPNTSRSILRPPSPRLWPLMLLGQMTLEAVLPRKRFETPFANVAVE